MISVMASEPDKTAQPAWWANYWRESRRPLTSLAFVLPLLALYEGGLLVLGPHAVRNGADVWMRYLLDLAGFGQYYFLPLLTIGLLLAWHHLSRDRWRVSLLVLYGMCVESCLLGLALVGIATLQRSFFAWCAQPHLAGAVAANISGAGPAHFLGRLVGFFGAGIYEEVLFRLLLLPLVAALLKLVGARPPWPILGAIVLTSIAFSAAHYIGPHGDKWELFSAFLRLVAGAFFATLFVYRGFGIAAGTHALYDIFVGFF
jgi:membrane protease YdiL (CAAX protease family)